MLKYVPWQWDHNKDELLEAIREKVHVGHADYGQLMKLTIRHILNGKNKKPTFEGFEWRWSEQFIEVDDGEYQGTLIFLIHKETYQPSKHDYLITPVCYGNCSGCDTIQYIRTEPDAEKRNKLYLDLCRDLLVQMKAPFNDGGSLWEEADVK